jgi:hypothetical protein
MIDATNSWFKLKTQDVLDLRNAGVTEKEISAMLMQPGEPSTEQNNRNDATWYVYRPQSWYYGYYPSWYFPSISVRLGYRAHHPVYFRHRRFR